MSTHKSPYKNCETIGSRVPKLRTVGPSHAAINRIHPSSQTMQLPWSNSGFPDVYRAWCALFLVNIRTRREVNSGEWCSMFLWIGGACGRRMVNRYGHCVNKGWWSLFCPFSTYWTVSCCSFSVLNKIEEWRTIQGMVVQRDSISLHSWNISQIASKGTIQLGRNGIATKNKIHTKSHELFSQIFGERLPFAFTWRAWHTA